MGGRQETGEALQDMNALFADQVIEKRCEVILGREFEEEDRTEMMNSGRHAAALEDGIKVVHEPASVQPRCGARACVTASARRAHPIFVDDFASLCAPIGAKAESW